MKISQKVNYACLAMLELAIHAKDGQPMPIKAIADAHKLKPRFLVQILLQLKTAGLVVSVRGASGGYQLAQSSEEITLFQVLEAVGHRPGDPSTVSSDAPTGRVLAGVWKEIQAAERRILRESTLADLVRRSQESINITYQI